jgi:DNA-binding LytR/AlgR family response regulator
LNVFEKTYDAQESGTRDENSLDSALTVRAFESAYEVLRNLLDNVVREQRTTVAEFRPSVKASAARPARIAIKTKGKILFLNPAEVLAVEAHGDHVLLRRESDSYSLRHSISMMEAHLKPHGFLRIHRSVLVNAVCVEEIQQSIRGDCLLRLSGKKEYSVSRTYRKNLRYLAQSWIGTDLPVD